MTTTVYFFLSFYFYCCWLDWVNPDTEEREEKETPTEANCIEITHTHSDELWDNPIMKASGLEKPRFKTNCLDKNLEHCEIEEVGPRALNWAVDYIEIKSQ